jgi:hypothetical protein
MRRALGPLALAAYLSLFAIPAAAAPAGGGGDLKARVDGSRASGLNTSLREKCTMVLVGTGLIAVAAAVRRAA